MKKFSTMRLRSFVPILMREATEKYMVGVMREGLKMWLVVPLMRCCSCFHSLG